MKVGIGGSLAHEVEEYRDDPSYELQRVLLSLNEAIVERMEAQGLRRVDLADRLGVSRGWVTRMLDGNENLTLKTIVKVANVLWTKVELDLIPRHVAYLKEGNIDAVLNFGDDVQFVATERWGDGEQQSALAA